MKNSSMGVRADLAGYAEIGQASAFDALVATVERMLAEERIACASRAEKWADDFLAGAEKTANFADLIRQIKGE